MRLTLGTDLLWDASILSSPYGPPDKQPPLSMLTPSNAASSRPPTRPSPATGVEGPWFWVLSLCLKAWESLCRPYVLRHIACGHTISAPRPLHLLHHLQHCLCDSMASWSRRAQVRSDIMLLKPAAHVQNDPPNSRQDYEWGSGD